MSDGAPVFLVRTRIEPNKPITPRQMAIIAAYSEGWAPSHVAKFLGVSQRTVRFHTVEASRRIPGDRPPMEKLIAWYRGATIEVLTGRQVWTPSDLSPRQLVSHSDGVVAISALAASSAPAPDYSPPDPNEQRSRKAV